MARRNRTKTEHAGAKNRGGFWGTREEAKAKSNRLRREQDKQLAAGPQESETEINSAIADAIEQAVT